MNMFIELMTIIQQILLTVYLYEDESEKKQKSKEYADKLKANIAKKGLV